MTFTREKLYIKLSYFKPLKMQTIIMWSYNIIMTLNIENRQYLIVTGVT